MAVQLFRRAAMAGNEDAMNSVGPSVIGMASVWRRTRQWRRSGSRVPPMLAASAPCTVWPSAFVDGIGAEKDETMAVHWFGRARRRGQRVGNECARPVLSRRQGRREGCNDGGSVVLARRREGSRSAMYSLARCWRSGVGREKDEKMAAQWFYRAANAGHSRAMKRFGECLRDGIGVDRDGARAGRLVRARSSGERGEVEKKGANRKMKKIDFDWDSFTLCDLSLLTLTFV
jgi:hypothetical protein